ncbi:MAG: FAD-dependent thymidylate synthase [Acidimicrobiales bacterium]|nr:FAD-dependent thymidylate synthase [Acidimicrobiales bacterium]
MVPYSPESFTDQEQEVLRRYVTNLDGPVFALVNLPEVVKGALFARYSRSAKSLRRLLLDEFVDDLEPWGSGDAEPGGSGHARADALYQKIFLDYGDESVAQLVHVHVACEQVSNVLTKVLERGRLMAYLEQSTRYVRYDSRLANGHFRYQRDPAVLSSELGARYVGEMDRMFQTYHDLLEPLQAFLSARHRRPDAVAELAWRNSVRARALDGLRGLLPAGSLSNVGIAGSAQAFERLIMRLRAHPLPEAQACAEELLAELRKVIPSLLGRLDRPDRGRAWVDYLASRREATEELAATLPQAPSSGAGEAPLVTLTDWDRDGEDKVIAAMVYPAADRSDRETLELVRRLSDGERQAIVAAYVGERADRRHLPGRALERTWYRFEVVSDYGAFRDLQRHRLLTIEWQPLSTELGFRLEEDLEEAGLADPATESLERSAELHQALLSPFPAQAPYAVALAYRIRYVIELNAREALHLIELRSSPQGHPSYRRVAQEMHRLIAEQAGHRRVASIMGFADHDEDGLGRLEAEQRTLKRRVPPQAAG